MKKLKKLLGKKTTPDGPNRFLRLMEDQLLLMRKELERAARNLTQTDNPKGKQGVLEWIPTFRREFGQGPFQWRPFNEQKHPFDGPDAFIKKLKKRGFKVIGDGHFSVVLAKDGQDKVIKVQRKPDNWMDYIIWASKKGQAGKLAPKVYSFKKIKGKKKNFSVAIVERLEYTATGAPEDHKIKVMMDMLWRADKNPLAAQYLDIIAPGLKKFVDDIREKFPNNNDFHGGNIMMRKDGSFVIVDPVAAKQSNAAERIRVRDLAPSLTFKLAA